MSALARSFSDLPVLRIGLEIAGEGEVVCSLEGREWRFSTSELGLPQRFDRRLERSGGYSFQFPAWAIDEIRAHLYEEFFGEPLWLHLERPSGYLGAVPWERLLQPALRVPILRLPVVEAGPPRETPGTLEVLLCASGPVATEPGEVTRLLRKVADQIREEVPRRVRVHVFTDQDFAIAEARKPVSEVKDRLESPWLLWMRQALSGRSVDVAHFICHGSLSFDRGALSVAERSVGLQELNTFLTQIGAWSTAFSAPENNSSEAGLRLLADSVAQIRPGPLLIHDLSRDPDLAGLGAAYRFLYAPFPGRPPASPALAIQCQPSRVAQPVMRGGLESVGAATAHPRSRSDDPLEGVFSEEENVPAWVAAATRYVEQQEVRLQETEAAPVETPVATQRSDAAADTLRQIQSIIAEMAGKGSGGGS